MAAKSAKTKIDAPPAVAKSEGAKAAAKPVAGATAPTRHPLARRRALAACVLGIVAVLTLGGRAIWLRVAPLVANSERYLLDGEKIEITPLPEWIVGDVGKQVIERAGIAQRLSILDSNFATTVSAAFALHPWVESVTSVEKRLPRGVAVNVVYRRPVAVVEMPLGDGKQLLPVDAQGIHLPAQDVPQIRLTYLPRITGVVGQPPTGQRWDDPRVAGAVDLAVNLAPEWEALDLTDIVPSAYPEVQVDLQYFVYDLVTRGRTRIVWGAAPRDNVPGEAPLAEKLTRLKTCVAQYAALDWTDWPEVVDIRRGVAITPRTAKKPPKEGEEPVVADRPHDSEAEPDEPVVR